MNDKLYKYRFSAVLQIVLLICLIIFGILSWIKKGIFFNIFYLVIGLELLIISYNNVKIFNKSRYNMAYVVVGGLILLYSIYGFLSYFKVI